jgi:DNA invertase Pin-like site-specific DNA recombinase
LERLAGPGPSRLVVSKLEHLSGSPGDLTALFEWFRRNDVHVIATDVGLDTTTPQGRRAAKSVVGAVAQREAQAHAWTNGRNGADARAKVKVATGAGHGDPDDRRDPG